jgi:putative transposase
MPRQVRIEFPGAVYHVMSRGDRLEDIYTDRHDREMFLRTLAEDFERTGWRVHAYVLMSNHYHLLLETPEANLVAGMTWLQTTYTVRFNARHKLRGHVFGGRYKAILVDNEDPRYFTTLIDYLHLNPVRAGLVKVPVNATGRGAASVADYEWSSLGHYGARPAGRPEFLETAWAFGSFNCRDTLKGRREFVKRVDWRAREEKAERCGLGEIEGGQSLQSTVRRGWYFGSETFRDRMLDLAERALSRKKRNDNYRASEIRAHGGREAERIIAIALEEFGLERADLPTLRKSDLRKVLIASLLRRDTTVPRMWIAQELEMGHPTAVSGKWRLLSAQLKRDRKLRAAQKRIEKRLKISS